MPRTRKRPPFRFTARSLPPVPAVGQVDYWDEALPGFGMRVSAGGTRVWQVLYRYNGVKRRMKLGVYRGTVEQPSEGDDPALSLASARDLARVVMRKAEKGQDPATEQRAQQAPGETVEDLAKLYIEGYAKKKKRSWLKDEQILNREVIPIIGRKRIGDVRRSDIQAVLSPIIEREAPIRANHTLEIVRKMFNWHISTLDHPIQNPAAGTKKPGDSDSRTRWLRPDELRRFWAALDPAKIGDDGAAAFMLLTLTLQREMEVVRMRWPDIDLDEATWTIPGDHAKNTLEHLIPLSQLAGAILRRLKKRSQAGAVYVFPSPKKADRHVTRVFIEKRIVKIREAAKLTDMVPHDLRRTGTTYFGKLKVPQNIKKKILNHANRRKSDVTDVYDRFEYLDEKRDALDKWEALLLEMIKPFDDAKVVRLARATV